MGYLNYEFFDEFKALDNLCRDIYGESTANKLGVTLYLEDMDRNVYRGACKTRRQQTSCTENMNHCHGRLNQFTSNPKIHGKI